MVRGLRVGMMRLWAGGRCRGLRQVDLLVPGAPQEGAEAPQMGDTHRDVKPVHGIEGQALDPAHLTPRALGF